ncbi:type VI secretion system baseplate subunit TssE [Pseudoduganella ginsengisoli]|uniref:Type VI secretion system baseplate subunit TssE n=1 Tax=Pseudoduganella ginsengisoli TaxID=1462440 RepID=A0A6L6PXC8_9BURK|nr:type VI secretion system baseplate subunit TssE [Pseudoduganella ginsengisoli]MTW02110.1 type VI secretion system baseplate subunit TssE [Pseudoduganella ginsengisoli]
MAPQPHVTPAGLLDRLLYGSGPVQTPAQLKESVARSLEDMLNTRAALSAGLSAGLLRGYPHCAASVANYGLADFAGCCLGSAADRTYIGACIRTAVERHEPRLRRVDVQVAPEPGAVNRIRITITGSLPTQRGTIAFDAVLQPSTLRYSINRRGSL